MSEIRARTDAAAGPLGEPSPGPLIIPGHRLEPAPGADRRLRRWTILIGALTVALIVLGLLAAAVAGVLVFVLEDGTTWSAAIGIGSCLLIGLGAPGDALPELLGLTSSILAIGAAVVFEGVALAAIVGFLVAAAGRVRGLQFGVAAAGIVAALLTAGRTVLHALHVVAGLDLPDLSLLTTLIAALVALGIGSVIGELVQMRTSRRRSANALEVS